MRWIDALSVDLAFRLDGLGLLLAVLVSGVGSAVVLYSMSYLKGDARLGRFTGLIYAFMASMLGLVLTDDLVLLFVFWELTTISSFFLIGFNSDEAVSRDSALKALLVTAAGGLALLAGALLLIQQSGTSRISELAEWSAASGNGALSSTCVALFVLAAMTKSAQFPFHFWLPGAMVAPTPVSAYLHSAAMVKAGIYLLARLSPILSSHPVWEAVLIPAGALTFAIGAASALRQHDLKLMMAHMTVTALGLMTFLLGVGTPMAVKAAVVYLVVHSLYKGAAFLVIGIIDHETGTRDLRRLGRLSRTMKPTAAAACLAGLSMAGIPLLFGFVGKELVYDAVVKDAGWFAPVAVAGFAVVVTCAALLGARPFFGPEAIEPPAHDAPMAMWIGPLLMGVVGLFLGLIPSVLNQWIESASGAVIGGTGAVHLAIWHGWTTALALSVLSVVLGLVFFRYWTSSTAIAEHLARRLGWASADRAYKRGLSGLMGLAVGVTREVQSGSLRVYLLVLIGFTVVLTAGLLPGPSLPVGWLDLHFHEGVLVAVMCASAVVAASVSSPLSSVIFIGVVGYAIAIVYVLFGAPDLAMTQFLVETLTVILLALTLVHLPGRNVARVGRKGQLLNLTVAAAGGVLVSALIWTVLSAPLDQGVNAYFSRNSVPLAHGRNIVNVILVDFRALDTLGEIAVLGIGGLGVHALLRLKRGRTSP